MKKVLHISSECFPAAKAGGMGDVVGALPAYLPEFNFEASVIIPKYRTKWILEQKFETIFKGSYQMGYEKLNYEVQFLKNNKLAYPLYCIDIPGKFDRESIYLDINGHGFMDERERNISFQFCVLEWLILDKVKFELIHCHDHMTGLIPFFVNNSMRYISLKGTPTVFTIHNGSYRGMFNWEVVNYFPEGSKHFHGLLDWDDSVNSLAAAIKCASKVTTVSPSYMEELIYNEDTLKSLYLSEQNKCKGILNGIDNQLWDPETDEHLDFHLKDDNFTLFKSENKSALLKKLGLKSRRPVISFIGRFAYQKGADVFISALYRYLQQEKNIAVVILGSGDKDLENYVSNISKQYSSEVAAIIAYDESLARQIYAGSDFMIMPSRFEPCGLNQLYCMRYGTIPIVRNVGGLKDTVPDINDNGNGISFRYLNENDIIFALERAKNLYKNKSKFKKLRNKIVKLDFSWSKSAKQYADLYSELIN